jgi:hypothetical protein
VRQQARDSSGRLTELQQKLSEAQDTADCHQAQALEAAHESARLQGELVAKGRQLEQAEAAVTRITEQVGGLCMGDVNCYLCLLPVSAKLLSWLYYDSCLGSEQ